ncbi:MAG: hypothetical protein AAGK02_01100 [Pseudomonadota bacterium]
MTADTIQLHRFTYGKLIAGNQQSGPIVSKYEHQLTGRSVGFPEDLTEFCQPTRFFRGWPGINGLVDHDWAPRGAFLYRPVSASGKLFGIFARLQGRSEGGEGKAGRTYTHCSGLVCALRNWHPGVVWRAYDILFASYDRSQEIDAGGPDVEDDPYRLNKAPVDVSVNKSWRTAREDATRRGSFLFSSGERDRDQVRFLNESDERTTPCPDDAVVLSAMLLHGIEEDLAAGLGAAEPLHLSKASFSVGLKPRARGAGDGFRLQYWRENRQIFVSFPGVLQREDPYDLTRTSFYDTGDLRWDGSGEADPPEAATQTTGTELAPRAASELGPGNPGVTWKAWKSFDQSLFEGNVLEGGFLSVLAQHVERSLDADDIASIRAFGQERAYRNLINRTGMAGIARFRDKQRILSAGRVVTPIGQVNDIAAIVQDLGKVGELLSLRKEHAGLVCDGAQFAMFALRVVNALCRFRSAIGGCRDLWALIVFEAVKIDPARGRAALLAYAAAVPSYMSHRIRIAETGTPSFGELDRFLKDFDAHFDAATPAPRVLGPFSGKMAAVFGGTDPQGLAAAIEIVVRETDPLHVERMIEFDRANFSQIRLRSSPFSAPVSARPSVKRAIGGATRLGNEVWRILSKTR